MTRPLSIFHITNLPCYVSRPKFGNYYEIMQVFTIISSLCLMAGCMEAASYLAGHQEGWAEDPPRCHWWLLTHSIIKQDSAGSIANRSRYSAFR